MNNQDLDCMPITHKSSFYFYGDERLDMGSVYIMDDFGNGLLVTWEMFAQFASVY